MSDACIALWYTYDTPFVFPLDCVSHQHDHERVAKNNSRENNPRIRPTRGHNPLTRPTHTPHSHAPLTSEDRDEGAAE
jgi:hypothetical protein